jgi:mRNA-degrading endonuclease RelE of RelBE toxin-antitoxin system
MVFKETSVFTRLVTGMMSDDEYRALQDALQLNPRMGPVIRGTGGLRKARWGLPGRGKRGGGRVIYYWAVGDDTILMLFIYDKHRQGDLTAAQTRTLAQVAKEEYGNG